MLLGAADIRGESTRVGISYVGGRGSAPLPHPEKILIFRIAVELF